MPFQRKPIHCKGNHFFQTVCISHFRTFKDIADTQRGHSVHAVELNRFEPSLTELFISLQYEMADRFSDLSHYKT